MDELYTNTFNHFYGYALMKLGNKAKAEDAVMAMYENIMRYIDTFNAAKGGTGWMFTILNRIIYKIASEDKEVRQNEVSGVDTQYIKDLNQMYETMELLNSIPELDDADRKIVYMYFFERRTLGEIAEILGLSTSAVHKRKQRIMKNIKKFMI